MIQQIDNTVLHFFGDIQIPVLNEIMIFVSALGNAGIIWIAMSILFLLFKKTRRAGATMAIALILGLLICNLTIKPLVARPRPFTMHELELLIPKPSDFSFPSGHSVSSFGAGLSALIVLRKKGLPLFIFGTIIAVSRLYLQVHYFSDVLCGCILGCLFAVIANIIVKSVINYFEKKGALNGKNG